MKITVATACEETPNSSDWNNRSCMQTPHLSTVLKAAGRGHNGWLWRGYGSSAECHDGVLASTSPQAPSVTPPASSPTNEGPFLPERVGRGGQPSVSSRPETAQKRRRGNPEPRFRATCLGLPSCKPRAPRANREHVGLTAGR